MKNFLILSILTIIFLCFNFFCTRYNFFVDKVANSSHKKFILHTDRIPLTGGLYLLIGYISSQIYIYNFSEIYFNRGIVCNSCSAEKFQLSLNSVSNTVDFFVISFI